MRDKVVIVVLSTIFSIGAAEILFRNVPPYLATTGQIMLLDEQISMGYRLKPNVAVPFTGMYEQFEPPVHWQTNSQGFRDNREPLESTGRYRIATFGDSDTFGWSVDLNDTFQRKMEDMDRRVEVLNFGVPGYNVTNIADYMELVVPKFKPNMVLYLANKNDFDRPLRFGGLVANSALLLRLRLIYQSSIAKPERIELRHSLERRRIFANELQRIAKLGQQHSAEVVVGFIKWKNWEELSAVLDDSQARLESVIRVVNTEPAFVGQPRVDDHISAPGYASLAVLLCRNLSGYPDKCLPKPIAKDRFAAPKGASGSVRHTRPAE